MKKSYEKIVLIIAVLAAAGLAFMGFTKLSAVAQDFVSEPVSGGKNDTAVAGADKLAATMESMAKPALLESAVIGETKRPVDNFAGVALYAKKPEGNEIAKPVDPILDPPVHPPIPNTWWLENNVNLGFADSPARDEDNDGFSNLEEFEAKTLPNDAQSFPGLINKLQFVKQESIGYFLWFSSALGPEKYQFKIAQLPAAFEAAAQNDKEAFLSGSTLQLVRTRDYIGSGANIFEEGPYKDRFKLKSVLAKEVTNEATKLTSTVEFATIEDLSPNKKEAFEIPRAPKTKERPATVRYDRTAVLALNAAGEQGKEFKVTENTPFALPFSNSEKKYLLKTVTANSITVEYKDASGKTATIDIKKN